MDMLAQNDTDDEWAISKSRTRAYKIETAL